MALTSLPVRGAWVEMRTLLQSRQTGAASLPVRGAWVEITSVIRSLPSPSRSLPVRGAWVEIIRRASGLQPSRVAPRAGSVG